MQSLSSCHASTATDSDSGDDDDDETTTASSAPLSKPTTATSTRRSTPAASSSVRRNKNQTDSKRKTKSKKLGGGGAPAAAVNDDNEEDLTENLDTALPPRTVYGRVCVCAYSGHVHISCGNSSCIICDKYVRLISALYARLNFSSISFRNKVHGIHVCVLRVFPLPKKKHHNSNVLCCVRYTFRRWTLQNSS